MDFSSAFLLIVGFAYVVLVVYLANQQERTGESIGALRWLLYGTLVIMFMSAISMLQLALLGGTEELFAQTDPVAAFAAFVFIVIATIFCFQVVSGQPRALNLIRWVAGSGARYNPASGVHNAAFVLAMALLAVTIGAFVLGGGITGFALELETAGISPVEPIFVAVLEIAIALLGIGLAIRRTLPEGLTRLGLRLPTPEDVSWGIGGGILLYVVLIVFVAVWQSVTPPEQIEQQTQASQQLALSFGSLPMALIASSSAALGEEIFIRGALQPIFGLLPTSIFFTLLHTQFLITPGLLLILLISLGFGILRQRYSTTAAIIAHFVYNFIQLGLLVLALSVRTG